LKQVVIENPIINSAFSEPTRHFRFDDEGITNEILKLVASAITLSPLPNLRKKGSKLNN
jgi:type III restriction enzyme